jgi:hypothetical protein
LQVPIWLRPRDLPVPAPNLHVKYRKCWRNPSHRPSCAAHKCITRGQPWAASSAQFTQQAAKEIFLPGRPALPGPWQTPRRRRNPLARSRMQPLGDVLAIPRQILHCRRK